MPIDIGLGLTEMDETVGGVFEPEPEELFDAPPEQPINIDNISKVHAHQKVFITFSN